MTTLSTAVVRVTGWMVLALALMAALCPASARAQSPGASGQGIEGLRAQIKAAVAERAGAERVGMLWLRLATAYMEQMQTAEAEDGYARAVRLLRDSTAKAAYANALQGMARLYVATGRFGQAKDFLNQSLGIYEHLGDRMHVAQLQDGIALDLLNQHQYRGAVEHADIALKAFESEQSVDPGDLIAAYLTRSHALCWMGECERALEDVERARAVAQRGLAEDSLEMMAILAVEGMDKIRSGRLNEGGLAMREAQRLASSRTDLPQPVVIQLQLGILREYSSTLRDAHRKNEAKQVETETAQLETRIPRECAGCTVSVAALGFEGSR